MGKSKKVGMEVLDFTFRVGCGFQAGSTPFVQGFRAGQAPGRPNSGPDAGARATSGQDVDAMTGTARRIISLLDSLVSSPSLQVWEELHDIYRCLAGGGEGLS
jgi:hypothetical protein